MSKKGALLIVITWVLLTAIQGLLVLFKVADPILGTACFIMDSAFTAVNIYIYRRDYK